MDDDPNQDDQRQLSPTGTYSYAADLARKVLQPKGTPEQYKAQLLKQGVKPDEFKYSNYDQAFAGKPMVTKDELAQHFNASVPPVQETTLRDKNPYPHRSAEEWEGALNRAERAGNWDEHSRLTNAWEAAEGHGGAGATKFQQYTLPGGTNYRETLLHLPRTEVTTGDIAQKLFGKEMRFLSEDERQAVVDELRKTPTADAQSYRSSHWDTPNVLAHLRMSDRVLPGGQKALHLEELQSDWAQEGRKHGFDNEAKFQQLLAQRNAEQGDTPRRDELQRQIDEMGRKGGKGVPSAPYVDSTQKWVDLGLKRLLHEAATGGYHKIVMTPGEEQAKRYDLSKHVRDLSYEPDAKLLQGRPVSGHRTDAIIHHNVEPEKLPDIVGKEVAQKLLASPRQKVAHLGSGMHHHLPSEDLKVGGEGMKAFYDQMLPKALEKLAKKHDPEAKVRLGGHRQEASLDWKTIKANKKNLANAPDMGLHSLDITPKMRASILKGQTAYATGGSVPDLGMSMPPDASVVPQALDIARQQPQPRDQDPAASHAELSRLLDKTRKTQIGKMVDQYQDPAAGTAVKRIHGDLKGLAQEGEPGRMWYEKSSKRILDYTQGNKDEAHKIAQLIAIYSPQTGVPTNTANAIKAYNRAKTGQPMWAGDIIDKDKSFDTIKAASDYAKTLGKNVTKVPLDDSGKRFLFARHNMKGYENIAPADRDLKAHLLMNEGIPFEGRKTNNFYRNLMTHIDPNMKQGSTQDLWMARAFGFHDDAVSNANKYDFMEKLTHKLGKELGWKPHQVQAAIWTAMKTRQEAVKGDVMKEAVEHGIGKMVPDKDTGKPSFELDPGKEHLYNSLMRKRALGAVLDPGHIQRSARDFSDFLDQNLAHVSWEATPSKQIAHLNGLEQKPPEVKADYHKRISEALQDEHGNDLLSKYLGVLSPGTVEAPGYWQGNGNPAAHTQIAATRIKAAGQRPDIDAASKELLNHYADARGLLLKQDAVGYHRPFYNPQVSKANGVEYQFDKDLTGDHIRKLGETMDQHVPDTAVVPSGPRTIRVLNFSGMKDHRPYHKAVDEALQKSGFSDTLTAHKRLFASDGDLRGNDWKVHPHGEDYRQRLGAAGRSDVLRYVSDVLAPKVQAVDEEFAKEHGLPRDHALEASLRRPPAEGEVTPRKAAGGAAVPKRDRTRPLASRSVIDHALQLARST